MKPQTANIVAIILSALGGLLILAGVFGVLARRDGLWAGIACLAIAGFIKKLGVKF
jgi:hypothetical protein